MKFLKWFAGLALAVYFVCLNLIGVLGMAYFLYKQEAEWVLACAAVTMATCMTAWTGLLPLVKQLTQVSIASKLTAGVEALERLMNRGET